MLTKMFVCVKIIAYEQKGHDIMIIEKQIEKKYRSQLFVRYDENGMVYYFSAKDFPGLQAAPYTFIGSAGQKLQGYFYSYASPISGRLLIFDHGLGGGHRAYMKEIELLARHGYLVFAYDHTGCMESEGESVNGFAQSLNDLDRCICSLKENDKYTAMKISVIGHSWGAFACMNIAALHHDIHSIVAISGFISVEQMLSQMFHGALSIFYKYIYRLEAEANPEFINFNAVESLRNTDAEVLLIHSADDSTVSAKYHFHVLRRALSGKKNISFILTDGKGHNPNYTCDAVKYKDEFFSELTKAIKHNTLEKAKQDFVARFDWDRMTQQDPEVWDAIFNVLDR